MRLNYLLLVRIANRPNTITAANLSVGLACEALARLGQMVRHIVPWRVLPAMSKVIRLIRHAVEEQVGVADEGVAWSTVWAVHHSSLMPHFRCVETRQSGHSVVDLSKVDTLKIILLA